MKPEPQQPRRTFASLARRYWMLVCGVSLLVCAPLAYLLWQALHLPLIHDISTYTQDPPVFIALLEQRKDVPNGLDYLPEVAAQQKLGYPDIAPLLLPIPAPQAFANAERAARAMGWQLVAVDANALRLEATATTLVFRFKDDVVVRIRAQGTGSRVDVRSVSRVGRSDIGANAARIRAYLDKLR